MDAKSLARSKRAHSLHHSKKPHPNPKPKPSTDRSTDAVTKAPEKPVGNRPRSSLPSNWDRYEDELDPDVGELPGNSNRQLSEVPLPKSKGADYRQLIDEAKSQPFSRSDPFLDTFPTVDDIFPDFFTRGGGSLLSAQGERILQSINDESFIVEEKRTPSHEAPLLSLNLNALAEQLSKIDVAKRLFLEPELLPPKPHVEAATTTASSKNITVEVQKGKAEEVASKQLDDFDFDFIMEEAKMDENQVAVDMNRTRPSEGGVTIESRKQATSSTFKAASAEAELDALLNGQVRGSWVSNPPSTVNIDVLLDDLLEETSEKGKDKGPQVMKANLASDQVGSSAPPSNAARSKLLLNDFDSWFDTV